MRERRQSLRIMETIDWPGFWNDLTDRPADLRECAQVVVPRLLFTLDRADDE